MVSMEAEVANQRVREGKRNREGILVPQTYTPVLLYKRQKCILFIRLSTVETLNFDLLNECHMNTLLFYNFLIIVFNKYSITSMETP